VIMRQSADGYPKGGQTLYEHRDNSVLGWSEDSHLEMKGDGNEFLRLGKALLRSIDCCIAARPPFEKWLEVIE
jgi:hypothetical protein